MNSRLFSFSSMLMITLALSAGLALADHGPHWGYEGGSGPDHWAELDPGFAVCRTGRHQSPIDLAEFVDAQMPPLGFRYMPGGRDEVNNGHTIQIDYEAGSSLILDGRRYELKQFHFHTPSENHIAGKEFPMEVHLVHADRSGRLAVVAVMMQAGAENPTLAAAWPSMPERANSRVHLAERISASGLLPTDHDYYRFTGSLTTPPCTEGVAWVVMKHPVTASAEQIRRFAEVMHHPNNRPIQPVNARAVLD